MHDVLDITRVLSHMCNAGVHELPDASHVAFATRCCRTVFILDALCGRHDMEKTRKTNQTSPACPLVLRDITGTQVGHGDVEHSLARYSVGQY